MIANWESVVLIASSGVLNLASTSKPVAASHCIRDHASCLYPSFLILSRIRAYVSSKVSGNCFSAAPRSYFLFFVTNSLSWHCTYLKLPFAWFSKVEIIGSWDFADQLFNFAGCSIQFSRWTLTSFRTYLSLIGSFCTTALPLEELMPSQAIWISGPSRLAINMRGCKSMSRRYSEKKRMVSWRSSMRGHSSSALIMMKML